MTEKNDKVNNKSTIVDRIKNNKSGSDNGPSSNSNGNSIIQNSTNIKAIEDSYSNNVNIQNSQVKHSETSANNNKYPESNTDGLDLDIQINQDLNAEDSNSNDKHNNRPGLAKNLKGSENSLQLQNRPSSKTDIIKFEMNGGEDNQGKNIEITLSRESSIHLDTNLTQANVRKSKNLSTDLDNNPSNNNKDDPPSIL